jgi:hypothetical protein
MYEVPRYGYKIGVRLLFGPMRTKERDAENGLDWDCVRIGVWELELELRIGELETWSGSWKGKKVSRYRQISICRLVQGWWRYLGTSLTRGIVCNELSRIRNGHGIAYMAWHGFGMVWEGRVWVGRVGVGAKETVSLRKWKWK